MKTKIQHCCIALILLAGACTNEGAGPTGEPGTAGGEVFGSPAGMAPSQMPVQLEMLDVERLRDGIVIRGDDGERYVGQAELYVLAAQAGACEFTPHANLDLGGWRSDGVGVGLTYRVYPGDAVADGEWAASVTTDPVEHDGTVMGKVFQPPDDTYRQIRTGSLQVKIDQGRIWGRFETDDAIGSFDFYGRIAVSCTNCQGPDKSFETEPCAPYASLASLPAP